MKKINFKEVAFLLRQSQYLESVNLAKHIKKHCKTKGARAATKILYFALLDQALNKPNGIDDANWIVKPKSFALPDAIKEWIIKIKLDGLFEYFQKSTYKDSLQSLRKAGLIFVDNRNSIHIKYPINNNMLSPKFAFISILSQKKKLKEKCSNEEKDLDKDSEKEYNTETENVIGSGIDWSSM